MRSLFRPQVNHPSRAVPRTAVRRVSIDSIVTPRSGMAFAEEPLITIQASAFGKIWEHAESDLRCEVGGLLIGELYNETPDHSHVEIGRASCRERVYVLV